MEDDGGFHHRHHFITGLTRPRRLRRVSTGEHWAHGVGRNGVHADLERMAVGFITVITSITHFFVTPAQAGVTEDTEFPEEEPRSPRGTQGSRGQSITPTFVTPAQAGVTENTEFPEGEPRSPRGTQGSRGQSITPTFVTPAQAGVTERRVLRKRARSPRGPLGSRGWQKRSSHRSGEDDGGFHHRHHCHHFHHWPHCYHRYHRPHFMICARPR